MADPVDPPESSRFAEPILHVDMDAFFVEVERLRNPALIGRPVAVGGAGPRGVVASASYEARRFGVRSAMPGGEARRRCPELVFVAPDHGEYSRISERVFEVFREFTPLVEGLSVDEAFLDVSGLRRHFGSSRDVGEMIRGRIRTQLGLPASVGVAGTKFVAKLASQRAKPDGLVVIGAREQQAFLDGLNVSDLWGVGAATEATLLRLGIASVVDIRTAPPGVLERELGDSLGGHLRRLAVGDDERSVDPDTAAKSISMETTFPVDRSSPAELKAELRHQAEGVARRLRRAGLLSRTVSVKLRLAGFTTLSRSVTLAEPTDTTSAIVDAALGLATEHFDGRAFRLVGVGASNLVDGDMPRQLRVDDDPRDRSLDAVLDAVSDRFGSEGVRRGVGRP